jgi:hypothetical protein
MMIDPNQPLRNFKIEYISQLATSDLVDELAKRKDEIKSTYICLNEGYIIIRLEDVYPNDGYKRPVTEMYGSGETRILVVK